MADSGYFSCFFPLAYPSVSGIQKDTKSGHGGFFTEVTEGVVRRQNTSIRGEVASVSHFVYFSVYDSIPLFFTSIDLRFKGNKLSIQAQAVQDG